MAYTAATVIPTTIKIFQWARPDHPNPRLASPIRSNETTAKFSSMPKDYAGNNITGAFFMGVRRASDGLVTNFYVPAAAINATTLTATGLIRIRTNGLDYTTDDDINDPIDHNADDQVFCNYSPVFEQMLYSVWTGALGLNASAIPYYASAPTFTPGSQQLCTIAYADALAIAGSPNISTTTKGIGELATQAEVDARTATGGTGASLLVNPANIRTTLWHDYAADAVGTDSYAITCTPAVTAYATGDVYLFKAGTINTGAATLNVNALGAKPLKAYGLDPRNGHIAANSHVLVSYDGTNMNILSASSLPQISQDGQEIFGTSTTGNDTYVITLSPVPAAYATGAVYHFIPDTANTGAATLNINALGAKDIKKFSASGKVALTTGDILANQPCEVMYDGTDMVLISAQQTRPLYSTGQSTRAHASGTGTQNIAHGLGVTPRRFRIYFSGTTTTNPAYTRGLGTATGTSDETCTYTVGASNFVGQDSSNIIHTKDSSGTDGWVAAVSAVDATNITLNFTTAAAGETIYFQWEAEA